MSRPRILILSFSPIATDARVLKQVALASQLGDVVTCGYGPTPPGAVEHHRIPDELSIYPLNPRLLLLRLGRRALRTAPAVTWALDQLREVSADAVIADDLEAVPVALARYPARTIHADLHEYTPGQHSNDAGWRRHLAPLYRSLVRREVRRVGSVTTVAPIIRDEYERLSGRDDIGVVINATPFRDATPQPVGEPIRLVHSGVALRNRRLELMLDAVERTTRPVRLDLYLMPNDPAYLAELRDRADAIPGLTVHPAVPYADLVDTLAAGDVGVFVLPPITQNYEWALPNKLFDFVQARLGVIIGPSSQMAAYVEGHGFGTVLADFTADSLAAELDGLTAERVAEWKAAAHAAARDLSAEAAEGVWRDALVARLEASA